MKFAWEKHSQENDVSFGDTITVKITLATFKLRNSCNTIDSLIIFITRGNIMA